MSSADARQDSKAASDSVAAFDSDAAFDPDGAADGEVFGTSDSTGDTAAEDCSAPERTAASIRAFLACLAPFIETMGYTATDNSSTTQANWEYLVGSNPAGSVYSAQGGAEIHVVGHYLAGDKELATKFLQTQNVTAKVILECFIP